MKVVKRGDLTSSHHKKKKLKKKKSRWWTLLCKSWAPHLSIYGHFIPSIFNLYRQLLKHWLKEELTFLVVSQCSIFYLPLSASCSISHHKRGIGNNDQIHFKIVTVNWSRREPQIEKNFLTTVRMVFWGRLYISFFSTIHSITVVTKY